MPLHENDLNYSAYKDKLARSIYAELNKNLDLNIALSLTLKKIRQFTGIEASAIRLEEKGDYIYYVFDGFPASFIKRENSIVATDKNGNWLLSPDKKGYILECMCGNIIKGRTDPSLSHFTQGASFWTNSTTKLLATTTEKERLTKSRNYCNYCGYESVALIPIKANGITIGLLQLTDNRKEMFSLDLIEFMEKIGKHIGYAVQNNKEFNKLKVAASRIKLLNVKLKKLADKDHLTGLFNRRSFIRIMKLEKKRSDRNNKTFTVIMADIDNFKKINDSYGHEAGDTVLVKMSKQLKKSRRDSDIVSRWGGDEFIILLPETSSNGGIDLANKLMNIFRKKVFKYSGNKIKITMSFGVYKCAENVNIKGCIKNVDILLLRVKATGKDNVLTIEN